MSNARKTACLTLVRQEQDGYSDIVLSNALDSYDGLKRDKAFITALFYGTIERLITLDAILNKYLSKSINRLDKEVRAVLRMGLYQAKYMNSVPVSAAINEAVKLTRQLGKSSAASMVNAVLRKAVNTDEKTLCFKDEAERLSVLFSVSQSVVRVFENNFKASCEEELQASFTRLPVCICVNNIKITSPELITALTAKGIKIEVSSLPNCLYIDGCDDIRQLDEFENGYFHVQGEASQYACAALSPEKGSKVVDLCAAPGGKSATLAQYLNNTGKLFCADATKSRLPLIDQLLKRNGISNASVILNDASIYNESLTNADYVLCDVPCSGLGIISKKPDIRYKTFEDIEILINLQKNILNTASKYLKIGGKLVYSTCTINSAENEEIVNSFLKQNSNYNAVELPAYSKSAKNLGKFKLFTPLISNLDGFFVACLERLW